MSDYLVPVELLNFLLFDWLKVDMRDGIERETVFAILETATRLAEDNFAACYRECDIKEPHLAEEGVHILPQIRDAHARYAELGLFGMTFPEQLGGIGLPNVVGTAIASIFASANVSASGYAMLTAGNARLIATFGSPAQIEAFARPQIAGRWFGTMCLSEPQAGSSLGDIRTRAVREGEDALGVRYRLTGNKMWISGGDQDASENIVHLVLAKAVRVNGNLIEGSKGISLFIVPKILPDGTRNDIHVAGLNHKMGNRGTTNCLLNFGEENGATGWLVGTEGRGLAQMFHMMNEARIGVGLGAAALAYRGYRHAVRYASERTQGREIGVQGGGPIPIMHHPDVRRMLLQQKVYAEGALAVCHYCSYLVDTKTEESEKLVALLTPIAKSWPSEFGVIANDLAIQVHGGYGYTRDFDVEQLWRDNRLNPIHEGTTGIQAIDLLRRKILLSDARATGILRARIDATAKRAETVLPLAGAVQAISAYWEHVSQVIERLRRADLPAACDDATLFLRAFGHGVIGWLLLDIALASYDAGQSDRAESSAYSCRFFVEMELPQARAWLDIVDRHSRLVRFTPDRIFV